MLISVCTNRAFSQSQNPDTLSEESGGESIEEQINYSAEDSIVAMPEQGKAMLYGKAKVDYGSMNIQSEIIEIDYKKNVITAYGKLDSTGKLFGTPVFKDGAEPLEAEKIMYNLKSKRGKIFNALTKQGELMVFGSQIKKDSNNVVYFSGMKCLPCNDKEARTAFIATKAKVIPNDKIVTGPMFLSIAGVPTPLGLPFGFFPNTKKQHNGILLPQYGYSANQGFFLKEGGFYWGINDKTDMIIKGDIYSNGSWALNTTNDYSILYKAHGSLYLGYKQFNIGDRDVPRQFSKLNAFEIRWQHAQDNKSNPTITFNSNVNIVKNQNVNKLNQQNPGAYLQNTFLSNINFTKAFKKSSLSLIAQHNQNTQTHSIEFVLPSLTYNVNRFFPFRKEGKIKETVIDKIGISYSAEMKNSLKGIDSTIFKGNIKDSLNYGLRQSLPISTNFNIFKYITATPALNLTSYSYMKSTSKEFAVRTINYGDTLSVQKAYVKTKTKEEFITGYDANFSTSFSTKVYFDYLFKKGKLKQIRHFLIPTVAYVYRPDFGQSQYGFYKNVQRDSAWNKTKYSIYEKGIFGGPSLGKQNMVTFNLSNNVEAKYNSKTDTGVVSKKAVLIQNAGITGAYNFSADSFKMQNIGFTARTTLFKYLNLNWTSVFDPYVYDHTQKRRVNKFLISNAKSLFESQPLRFYTGEFACGTSLSKSQFKKKNATAAATTNTTQIVDWSLTLNYKLALNNLDARTIKPSHQLSAGININPTQFWKLNITTGYDFLNQKISYTNFTIGRDLRCWEANIAWVPFGPNKSYNLTLNLKNSMLREFKIPRRKQFFDNF